MKIYYVVDTSYDDEIDADDTEFFLNREAADAICYEKESARKKFWAQTNASRREKYEVEDIARKALDEAGISWKDTSLRYSSNWRTEEYTPGYEVRYIEVIE